MDRLFFLFTLLVTFPLTGHCAAYTSLVSWAGWGSSSKAIQAPGEISKLSFIGSNPPLLLTYDRKAVGDNGKTISELENNQFYVILDSQPGNQFNFCFRTPPASSTGNFPSPPVFKKPVTGQAMPDIQNGDIRRIASAPDSDRWQHEYSARWRLPAGHQSLVLAIEDNDNGWVIEPECSGFFSESAALPSSHTSANKKTSFVDIFYRNQQAVKNGLDHSDDKSRLSGPFAIPGASGTADNSEPFISSGGGGFGSSDDLGDLFKRRPGGGIRPLYSFEWMSEQFSRVILLPGTGGQTVKKQIWDNRIVLTGRYAQQEFILSPKQLRSVTVFPGQVPTGIGHPGGGRTRQAGSQADLNKAPAANTRFQSGSGRQSQGSSGGRKSGRESGGDGGAGGSPNRWSCLICGKPLLAYNRCKACLDRDSSVLERELTEELPPAIGQDSEVSESGTKQADTSAIRLFEWFKTLNSNSNSYIRESSFHISHDYNFPTLYKLLTQSFMSDKNTLSKFYSKWVKFLNYSMSLYQLISEVGELAKSQGIEDYVEVARIVETLAVNREEFESETRSTPFRNVLLDHLRMKKLSSPYDPDQIYYSRLGHQEKAELINYIYQVFKETSLSLQAEKFPSRFITTAMLNEFARDVYAKYGFGMPDPEMSNNGLLQILMWGCGNSGGYSFITPYNKKFLLGFTGGPLHVQAVAVTNYQSLEFRDVEAMFTALVIIRSMLGPTLLGMFPERKYFCEYAPIEELELLSTFALKARGQLVRFLESRGAEEKDRFIHSMFLIFGMVPTELSRELLDPEPVPIAQAVAHEVARLRDQQSKKSTSEPVTSSSALTLKELLHSEEQACAGHQETLQNAQNQSNHKRRHRKRSFKDAKQSH